MPSSPPQSNAWPACVRFVASPASGFTIALGRLARRGFAETAGKDRSGRAGFVFSRLDRSMGTPIFVGACDPSALERDTGGSGADVERGVIRSAADVMNVFGSYSCVSQSSKLGQKKY